jgi:hypothetical protein
LSDDMHPFTNQFGCEGGKIAGSTPARVVFSNQD